MRLTLRTLLAWLDDTLKPGEVRQIGQQVAETPLAQELVDRIHRVTRQRRLTVPPGSGPDATDPATVASYIDDGLEPDEIVEFEKKCLTSDVHLAEVASVHQILSLLAQKAKVPAEARERMYHLIKGREAVGSSVPRTFKPPKPVTAPAPVAAWSPESTPRPSFLERYGLAGGIAALCLVLLWSAYMSLGNGEATPAGKDVASKKKGDAAVAANVPAKPAEDAANDPMPPGPEKKEESDKDAAKATPKAPAGKPLVAPELAPIPAGASGVVGEDLDAVLLRFHAESPGKWDRLAANATLKDGDRIVNLPSFVAPLQVGSARLTMVGDGEVAVLEKVPGTSARFDLKRGRLRVVGGGAEPIAIPFDAGVLKLSLAPGSVVGLERINHRMPGEKLPSSPALRIAVVEGEAIAEAGTARETISAGSSLLFRAPDQFSTKDAAGIPPWATETAPSEARKQRGRLLAAYFKPDRQPKACVVEAASDENPEVKADAVTSFAALNLLDILVATMSTANDPTSRKAAIAALREVARRDADSAKALRASLEQIGGSKTWADAVEALLVGYTPREARLEATGAKLGELLKHEDVGIRELAAEAILTLAGKDDLMGYNPDKPLEGPGLKNLQELILKAK